MDRLIRGINDFRTSEFPKHQKRFEELAGGQSPETLFITCSDSRIETAMITQTDPGELFICRNAGNIVPPCTNHTGAMTASIEFAVGALEVAHVIVCGHADCGAMKAILEPDMLADMPHVRDWLHYARGAALIAEDKSSGRPKEALLDALIEENVIQQINHLKTHPHVAKRLAAGKLEIHGWVYDIENGDVRAFDEKTRRFYPVSEYYAEYAS